jgi:hypothetical protein
VALFVALTRAVREAPVPESARHVAYDIVDRMAHAVGLPRFEVELEALIACATQEPRFFAPLQPFRNELRALSAAPSARVRSAPKDGRAPAHGGSSQPGRDE